MEVVIFVGLQAAGKSSFFRSRFAATHRLISKDLMRNRRDPQARQLMLLEQALRNGESVVVDNTNPRAADRASIITLARSYNATITGYLFDARPGECLRRNALRQGRARVPDVAIYATAAKLEYPRAEEGFDAIFRVGPGESGFQITPELTFPANGASR